MDIDNDFRNSFLIRFRRRRARPVVHRRHYGASRAGLLAPAPVDLTETRTADMQVKDVSGASHAGLSAPPPIDLTETRTAEIQAKNISAASLAAWGYVFQVSTQSIAVGAPINYSNNGPLSGVNHEPGTSRIEVVGAGIYSISFSVYTAQNNPQDWAVIVNGVQRSRFNSAGQTISGVTLLSLNAGDSITIRNINTSPDPARLRTGEFTTAYVLILKVN